MRELTLAPSQVVHPEHVGDRTLWIDPEVRGVVHKLQHGDPTIGWEGDPRLAVYYNGVSRRWELHRFEADGEYRFVAQSPVGARFDERIIADLVARDRNRGYHPLQTLQHNDRVDRKRSAEFQAWVSEEAAPRLRHAVRGDL